MGPLALASCWCTSPFCSYNPCFCVACGLHALPCHAGREPSPYSSASQTSTTSSPVGSSGGAPPHARHRHPHPRSSRASQSQNQGHVARPVSAPVAASLLDGEEGGGVSSRFSLLLQLQVWEERGGGMRAGGGGQPQNEGGRGEEEGGWVYGVGWGS